MKRILIVDDAVFMRVSLKTMLERNGFEVIGEAVNGLEAIEKYSSLKPDIVTMDITMPEMSGLEAVKAIKKIDSNAKILMVSAMGQEKNIFEAVKLGAKNFIVKPFKADKVLEVIKTLE